MTQTIDYEKLAKSLMGQMVAQARKAVSTTPDAKYGHGPTGLFSAPGVDPDIYNAMQLPVRGLEALLPSYPTQYVTPVYNIITGQTADSGSEPTTACADWPEAGVTKLCGYQTTMGRFGRSTTVFDISRVGQQINRSDMIDYTLVGDPLSPSNEDPLYAGGNGINDSNAPTGFGGDGSASLNSEIAKAMRELRVSFVRAFSKDIYTANPANNPGAGNGRKYYKGLDLLINTGYADYETSTVCPASDSLIVDWGSLDIASNGPAIVFMITDMWRRLNIIADEAGMTPVTWVLAMPRSLFYILSSVWPCAYFTAGCPVPAGMTAFSNVNDQINERDKMRRESMLLIDGEYVTVVQDTAITTTALTGVDTGSYTASIYFVPLKVRGNKACTYKQYFNFNGPGAAMDFLKGFGANNPLVNNFRTSDNGKFLWLFQPPSSYCVQMEVMAMQTLVLRVPYLAARLLNVRWTPLSVERSPYPGDATYVNGGKTNR